MRTQTDQTLKQMAVKTAAILAAFAFCTNSHAAGDVNLLLPSPDYAPGEWGRSVLIDPFSTGPAHGVFIGLWGASGPNVLRLTPVDAVSSAFHVEEVDQTLTAVLRIVYNDNEGIYAGGRSSYQYTRRDRVDVWTVRRSAYADQGSGNTWKNDDRFYFTTVAKNKSVTPHYSSCRGIASNHAGAMFATGVAYNGTSYRWVIRRKLPGSLWQTVRDEPLDNFNMNQGLCSFSGNLDTPPAMFVVGSEGFRWAILRSQNQGDAKTWVKVDDWPEGPAESAAVEAAVDAAGNIYVVGYRGANGNNPSSWTVRRSSDGGDTWTTMLDVPGSTVTAASGLAIDSTGAVTISGTVTPDGTTRLWKVIRCTQPDSPAAWTAAFDAGFFPFDGFSSQGSPVAADPYGNLFLGGTVRDWTDENNTFYSGARAALVRIVPPPSSVSAESASPQTE